MSPRPSAVSSMRADARTTSGDAGDASATARGDAEADRAAGGGGGGGGATATSRASKNEPPAGLCDEEDAAAEETSPASHKTPRSRARADRKRRRTTDALVARSATRDATPASMTSVPAPAKVFWSQVSIAVAVDCNASAAIGSPSARSARSGNGGAT